MVGVGMWVNWRISGKMIKKIDFPSLLWVPGLFLLIDCVLLFLSVVWIFHSLRFDKQAMGNEKWMAIHTILLTITLAS